MNDIEKQRQKRRESTLRDSIYRVMEACGIALDPSLSDEELGKVLRSIARGYC